MARVCIIDDKDVMRDSMVDILGAQGHQVAAYADPRHALREVSPASFDVIVSDLKMPDMDGLELLRSLRSSGVETPFVLMTAYASVPTAVEAMKLGAFDYIQKPFEADAIALVVGRAASMAQLRGENEVLRATLDDLQVDSRLVGGSRAMQQVRAQIERVAKSQATVLIQGESGTGKELASRAIHAASPRASGPIMCLNCAALSASLLESELFGHERGAFTGADKLRKGRFELAAGGTLLLDEISEVPLPIQAKLLRVLQEHEFERVGSSITQSADVRVIVTTNRDLADWVARRRFREDLFFRVSVLPLTLPPLRDRREDIPELVEHFIGGIARREGRRPKPVSTRALHVMESYHWPGNIRELQNVCERALVLSAGEEIDAALIEPWLSTEMKLECGNRPLRPGHMVEDMERGLIEQTLVRFNGHREKTAKALGIGVRTLGMKLKRWREEAALAVQQNQRRAS
ncbi:MAG: sigma-54 dependent transcriptional regulator [Planctomycetota bacterium]